MKVISGARYKPYILQVIKPKTEPRLHFHTVFANQVCKDCMKMKARSNSANGMLKYRLYEDRSFKIIINGFIMQLMREFW
jgi:hypothetical protein